jgi:hypothetical protein
MAKVFLISGYWKDDKTEFEHFLVTDIDHTPEGWEDEDFFYFGLSEKDLKEGLNSEETALEFVVTQYDEIEHCIEEQIKTKRMYKANTVVLIHTDYDNARKVCERVEGEFIEDFDNHPEFQDIDNYMVYGLTDFMDLVNTQELDNLGEYFISFVQTPER